MTIPAPRPDPAGPIPDADLWVFGYGSLLWRPGFPHARTLRARARGWRRAFCLRSIRYRGTPERPGLVLALDFAPHLHCDGIAFQVPAAEARAVRDYLHEREMGTRSYLECWIPLELETGETVTGLVYAIDRTHKSYVTLPLQEQAEIIALARGPAGPNREYLRNTAQHLADLGVRDEELERLDAMVAALPG